ncbi:MAG: hypothetical protein R2880_06680 [Deinococcales bacterium]
MGQLEASLALNKVDITLLKHDGALKFAYKINNLQHINEAHLYLASVNQSIGLFELGFHRAEQNKLNVNQVAIKPISTC